MARVIDDEETGALVRRWAQSRHISEAHAVRLAVGRERKRADRLDPVDPPIPMSARSKLQARSAALPDRMTADEVDCWMFGEDGLPHRSSSTHRR